MQKRAICLMIFSVLTFFISCKDVTPKPPKRVAGIPEQATWAGGVEGGNWFEITKVVSVNTFKIRIYNDYSGNLEADTMFILNKDCLIKTIDSTGILENLEGYDGEKIILSFPKKEKKCFLIAR